MLHVFLGTKAQYIKTAPLLRLLDERGVPYRLLDSGQHAGLGPGLRDELGVREPDLALGRRDDDVTSIGAAARWGARLATPLLRRRDAERLFPGGGVCVVHGDTPSTLLSALLARRAGLAVAHLEAGLRSHALLHPFPEEAIRLAVMRLSSLLFAPDDTAVANLRRMRVRGRVVALEANTSVESLRAALGRRGVPAAGSGPAIVTCHRVENLERPSRVRALVEHVTAVSPTQRVRFVVHGPTAATLRGLDLESRLKEKGVELEALQPHGAFAAQLAAAPWVITDGGSVQEECALLGVPTLLWRRRTERPDGLGANVVLSGYDDERVRAFLAAPERWRRPAAPLDARPSERILAELLAA